MNGHGLKALSWMAVVLAALQVSAAQTGPQTLRNEFLEIRWDATTGLSLNPRDREAGGWLVRAAHPVASQAKEPARVSPAQHPRFGRGRALRFTHSTREAYRVELYPRVPFALIVRELTNPGPATTNLVRVGLSPLTISAPASPTALRELGTAGLTSVGTQPGSYVFWALAHPESRQGIVAGWLTHDRGNGVFSSRLAAGEVQLEPRIDYGRWHLEPGASASSETMAIGWFADARFGLEAWAETVGRHYGVRLPPQPTGYCTWYSDPHGGASDEQHLAELAEFAARELKPFGFSFVQIDDKWQMGRERNGPAKDFTRSNPHGPYPHGLLPITEQVGRLGLTAGLWFMPFAGDHLDPRFREHPEWFVRRSDGSFYETDWGGTSLDMTQPGAREHLRGVVQGIRNWGFRYFKMDGLWTGTATEQIYVNDGFREDGIGDAVFHAPDKTNIEAMRDGLRLVREVAGPGIFLSGCNLSQNMRSFSGAAGLVDSMRIGPDNGADWPKDPQGEVVGTLLAGPVHGSRKYFLHGRLWWNDPDPVYVRASMPFAQAQLITSWVAISGQIHLSTDWLPGLPPDRLDLLRRTMPPHGRPARPVDLFDRPIPQTWAVHDQDHHPTRTALGLYNWQDQPVSITEPLARLGLDPAGKFAAFDFWANQRLADQQGRLAISVPPRSCRIVVLRPVVHHPQALSTSRHVTQGLVDLADEQWLPRSHTLQGRSRVVGGDPYELRILLPEPAEGWPVQTVGLGPADRAAGVRARSTAESAMVRVRLDSAESREVAWSVTFARPDRLGRSRSGMP